MISVDLYLGLFASRKISDEIKRARAFTVGRGSVVVLAIVSFLLSIWQIRNPTGGSVAIFAQYGVYGLTTASLIPLASGMFIKNATKQAVTAGAFVALVVYFGLPFTGLTDLSNNPAVLATAGIVAGWIAFGITQFLTRKAASTAAQTSAQLG